MTISMKERVKLIYEKKICPECNSKLQERKKRNGIELYCSKCYQIKAIKSYND